jgi:hypothetical protein
LAACRAFLAECRCITVSSVVVSPCLSTWRRPSTPEPWRIPCGTLASRRQVHFQRVSLAGHSFKAAITLSCALQRNDHSATVLPSVTALSSDQPDGSLGGLPCIPFGTSVNNRQFGSRVSTPLDMMTFVSPWALAYPLQDLSQSAAGPLSAGLPCGSLVRSGHYLVVHLSAKRSIGNGTALSEHPFG